MPLFGKKKKKQATKSPPAAAAARAEQQEPAVTIVGEPQQQQVLAAGTPVRPAPTQYQAPKSPVQQQQEYFQAKPPPSNGIMKTPHSPISESSLYISEPSVTNIPVGDESLATIEITRELVKRFISDIWNRGEVELIPEVCHPSLRFNGHVGMDRVGHDGFARMVTTVREALTDYHCEIHSMVVETNKAFCRLRFTGKHTGNLLGYPPTGKTVAWMGASEFTCKNGKILKVWELGDVKSLEEQLRSI